MTDMVELLAPAGDIECLKSAVLFGADAVYIGMSAFGMRASPKNFTIDELKEGILFARKYDVKVYMTCNAIPTNAEADEFEDFIKTAADTGIDAVIAADFGVIEAIKKYAPNINLHISTQVGVTNYAAANALYNLGAKRIVLAREVSLADIKTIRKKTPRELELEVFVHGAMCVSFSGRCLLSNYFLGRDANRGECAQPCRWNYYLTEEKRPKQHFEICEDEQSSFILNAKDLCMIENLGDLIEAGVTSLKIEGRAKSAYYVAIIINAYRNALDCINKGKPIDEWIKNEVNHVSHRPYCTGFFYGHPNDCQYYESSGYTCNSGFIGVVNDYKDGFLEITQRNYFSKTDEIEAIAPKSKPVCVVIDCMKNSESLKIEIANRAGETVYIKSDIAFPKHTVLRRKIKK